MSDDERERTPEEVAESVQWLRDHGVKVETPEDRKREKQSHVDMYKDTPGARSFTVLRIPADKTQPMTEFETWTPPEGAGDVLPTLLKPFFTEGTLDEDTFTRQAQHQHGVEAGKISAETMRKVTSQGSVETFRLVPPADTNDYHGVYVYLDEIGMLKSLALNDRASALGESCGFSPPPVFYGDVFVGRVRTKPSPMSNVAFGKRDMDSGATWMTRAVQENFEFHQAMGQVTDAYKAKDIKGPQDGSEDGYTWTQTDEDVDIAVPLPAGCGKKDLKVKIGATSVSCVAAGLDFDFSLDLFDRIVPADSMWSISDGILNMTLEKKTEETWRKVAKL